MKKFKYIVFVLLISVISSCNEDDNTGDSVLTPSNPTVTIDIPDPSISLAEKDSTFTFPITLSEPQIADVIINVLVIDGDATPGEDFTMTSQVIIPASRTTGRAVISINLDDVPEETETFTIQIGDASTANAQLTPQTVSFSIMNVSGDDLPVELSWASKYYDATGALADPTDVADLIFYITEPDGTIVEEIDGSSFESFVIPASWPDGEYLLKAGIFSIIDPGDLGGPPTLDVSLDFSQIGKISPTTFSFPAAMVGILCDWNIFTLASVTKSGTDYTVTKVGDFEFNPNNFTGDVETTTDIGDFTSEIEIYDCFAIVNHNYQNTGEDLIYDINPTTHTITVDPQDIIGGAYTVSGSGTYDPVTYKMTLEMDLVDNANAADSYLDVIEVYTP